MTYCFKVLYLNPFIFLKYDYTLSFIGIVSFYALVSASSFGYQNRYQEGKNGWLHSVRYHSKALVFYGRIQTKILVNYC